MKMPAGVYGIYQDHRFNWNYRSEEESGTAGRVHAIPRGKVVGGSSSINAMVFLRGHPEDYNRWAAAGLSDWSYDRCLPYFRRLETSDKGPTVWRGDKGPVNVETGTLRCRLFDDFAAAAVELGYPLSSDLNGSQPEGLGRLDINRKNGRRCSSADAYLIPVLRRPNLRLVQDAHVTRVRMSGKRATGVRYLHRGALVDANATREVILCGGAYNSPQLLMLSGIGPAANLAGSTIDPIVDSPSVGQNLQDHLNIAFRYSTIGKVSMAWLGSRWRSVLAGMQWAMFGSGALASNMYEFGGFIRSQPAVDYPNLQYHLLPMLLEAEEGRLRLQEGLTVSLTHLRPRSVGSVTLRSADPSAPPVLRFNYLSEPGDVEDFVDGVERTREIVARPPLARLISQEQLPGSSIRGRGDIAAFVRETAVSIHHPCGTCRMGVDDLAVVDPQLRVKGVLGLRVVDASVMPSLVSANLNCPTTMIAEKASDLILGIQ